MTKYHTLNVDELASHLRADLDEVQRLYVPLRHDQLCWRPSSARWSVGQCLHHLVVTDNRYLERFGPSLEKARRRGLRHDGPHKGGPFGRWFTGQVGPRIKLKLKAPRSIAPSASPEIPADIADVFLQNSRRLLAFIDESRGFDLHRARIGSPVAPIVRLRVIDALRAVVAHDRRHLNQARVVTQEPGFPA